MRHVIYALVFSFALVVGVSACGSDEESKTPLDVADSGTQDAAGDATNTDTTTQADSTSPDVAPDTTVPSDTGTADTTTPSDTTTQADTSTLNDSTTLSDSTAADTTVEDIAETCAAVTGFEKGCGADANCVVGLHMIDCCGTTVAWGINHSERDRFDTLEAACEATFPACGCAPQPTLAEDGTTGWNVGVRCVDNQCQTYATDGLCDAVTGYEKGCGTDANCSIGLHQVDCCGSLTAIGMNHAELTQFEADEAACRATLPACDCMSQPTTAEDGNSSTDNNSIAVRCVQSTCETWVP